MALREWLRGARRHLDTRILRAWLGEEALVFAALRSVMMIGGVAALLIVPLRPEHRLHLAPLFGGFVLYNFALLAVLAAWAERSREAFLAALAADLALVFLLIWFTGGGESHFSLLYYLLIALNAYYFGPGIGLLAAGLASTLLAAADWLASAGAGWAHIGSRAGLLGLLAVALGHVASRERATRARAERLSQEVEAERAHLARAEQLAAVGRLSAKMAHEVRSPLGAINLNVDMLRDIVRRLSGPAGEEAQELLRSIQEEIRAVADLTEEYLVAARIPAPRLEQDSLNELLTELIGFLRPVAERQGVTIAVTLDAGLPLLPFDRSMVKQAVRSLIKNSLEALPKGGRIVVSARREGQEAVITVSDNGPGIGGEVAERLFEPFFTTKREGTGLGLSIAQQIAREHGGVLTWASRPGAGAQFILRFPLGKENHD